MADVYFEGSPTPLPKFAPYLARVRLGEVLSVWWCLLVLARAGTQCVPGVASTCVVAKIYRPIFFVDCCC